MLLLIYIDLRGSKMLKDSGNVAIICSTSLINVKDHEIKEERKNLIRKSSLPDLLGCDKKNEAVCVKMLYFRGLSHAVDCNKGGLELLRFDLFTNLLIKDEATTDFSFKMF